MFILSIQHVCLILRLYASPVFIAFVVFILLLGMNLIVNAFWLNYRLLVHLCNQQMDTVVRKLLSPWTQSQATQQKRNMHLWEWHQHQSTLCHRFSPFIEFNLSFHYSISNSCLEPLSISNAYVYSAHCKGKEASEREAFLTKKPGEYWAVLLVSAREQTHWINGWLAGQHLHKFH